MTLDMVNAILTGKFDNENDRQYWLDKKKELEQKEKTNKENERFYAQNRVYDR